MANKKDNFYYFMFVIYYKSLNNFKTLNLGVNNPKYIIAQK